ncbi:MAG: hypothetical protein KJ025_04975 [Burkholderiales bacterium]|nr:hypothetical protein [Burkholderiales bacterium]
MSRDRASNALESGPRRRRAAELVLAAIVLLFVVYAIGTLRKHATPEAGADGPLQVRTELMRGQPRHVADETIMGDCTPEEVAALQQEARARAPAVGR